jgi:hypothetical protein
MDYTDHLATIRAEYLRVARIHAASYRVALVQRQRRQWGTPYWKEALLCETAALADLMIAVRWQREQRVMLAWEQTRKAVAA